MRGHGDHAWGNVNPLKAPLRQLSGLTPDLESELQPDSNRRTIDLAIEDALELNADIGIG
jgi:hypothetical protein